MIYKAQRHATQLHMQPVSISIIIISSFFEAVVLISLPAAAWLSQDNVLTRAVSATAKNLRHSVTKSAHCTVTRHTQRK